MMYEITTSRAVDVNIFLEANSDDADPATYSSKLSFKEWIKRVGDNDESIIREIPISSYRVRNFLVCFNTLDKPQMVSNQVLPTGVPSSNVDGILNKKGRTDYERRKGKKRKSFPFIIREKKRSEHENEKTNER
eukprot:Trichotokara_eunicae@DN10620_c0_g1_i1.p1